MTRDPVALALVFDEVRRHYLETTPALAGVLRGIEARPDPLSSVLHRPSNLYVEYLIASLGIEATPPNRRALLRALSTAGLRAQSVEEQSIETFGQSRSVGGPRLGNVGETIEALTRCFESWSQPDADDLTTEILKLVAKKQHDKKVRKACGLAVKELSTPSLAVPLARLFHANSTSEMLEIAQSAFPALGLATTCRFLNGIGLPILHLDRGRVRVLERLGLIPTFDQKNATARRDQQRAALRVVDRLAHTTNHNVTSISLHLGLLSGGVTAARSAGAIVYCTQQQPQCGACPAAPRCLYSKLTEETSHPDDLPNTSRDVLRRQDAEVAKRAQENGVQGLTDHELLVLLLRRRSSGVAAIETATQLIDHFGSLNNISRASPIELADLGRGIGPTVAAELLAAFELGRRVASLRLVRGIKLGDADDVFRALHLRYRDVPQEVFSMVMLNAKLELIEHAELSRGTMTASLVDTRQVYANALTRSAARVIFVHNHPSGDPHPSEADRELTRQLREGGRLLGIRMLDHIILGRDCYYSFHSDEIHEAPEPHDAPPGSDAPDDDA